jgi:pentatricopeptide repeat domain-containing protein 1
MLCDITFSAFITACGDGGMWQLSLALFETISIARVLADVSSAAISACQKAGEWQRALALFQVMGGARIQRDAFSYSAAISAAITLGAAATAGG